MTGWYREGVAYIHDAGHAGFALETAPGILEILAQSGIHEGLVVDLGCGSGLLARELLDAGYGVLGIDISEAMVELARKPAMRREMGRIGAARVSARYQLEQVVASYDSLYTRLVSP